MSNVPPAFAGSIPEKYERYLGPYIFEPYAREIAARVQQGGIKAVLETACGTGRVTSHLRKTLSPDIRLVATDLNADMIAIAKRMVPEKGIEWQVADAQSLPFDDDHFDRLVCQFGLMFVPDKARVLREAYRVLKPGGVLLLSTWDKLENNPAFYIADQIVAEYFSVDPPRFFHIPFSMYEESELVSLMESAGFSNCRASLVKKEGRSDTAADVVMGMLEGSPIYTAIVERDPALLPVIKTALETELGKKFGKAPLVSSMQAWVVEGGKSISQYI